jgi:hypothetical protein
LLQCKLATGVNGAGGRIFPEIFLTTGVNDDGEKFTTGVKDAGVK